MQKKWYPKRVQREDEKTYLTYNVSSTKNRIQMIINYIFVDNIPPSEKIFKISYLGTNPCRLERLF